MSAIKKNVAKIQTELTHQHEIAEVRVARKRKKLIRRLFFFALMVIATGYLMISTLISQASTIDKKQEEKEKLQHNLSELKDEQNALKEEIIKLNDKDYIAKLARRDYFLSDNNEIIFNIPEEKKQKEVK
ncbi:septum formation initiator family protein [Bacillus sp. DNRA2]|uniref:FtsB family cell division protein n=1 Tax=Bacillus sp. DNRA2 TaxID=2723053 RepID=UPI00145EE8AC|nr:septum formation initiator family protein [Bacillus sp. DNRA2]NMD72202.1 septum formation initiator family protein [Bacillus sp. DNRA2]